MNWVNTAVKSILCQSYRNLEIIIIDGGSSDGTINILKKFDDHRIKLYLLEEYSFTKKMNYGIKQSNGNWIARMDADDVSHPDRIRDQVQFINKHQDAVLVSTFETFITPNNMIVHENRPDWEYRQLDPSDFSKRRRDIHDN